MDDNRPMGGSVGTGRGRGARRRTIRQTAVSSLTEFALRGQDRRAPDGRKLSRPERASLLTLGAINRPVEEASAAVVAAAHSPDVRWMMRQLHNPILMARRWTPKTPDRDLLDRAVDFLERAAEPGAAPTHALETALDDWYQAMEARRTDPAWSRIVGTPVSLRQFRRWQDALAAQTPRLRVIPTLDVPAEFVRALDMVRQWDELLERRGHVGERFSLREEVVRLHNWPGDQWTSGDDYATAQRRFHRRLTTARGLADDPVRDRIMERALYLREGLLLNAVDDLEWFLAVLQFRAAFPEALEVRPELMSWRVLDWIARAGRQDAERPPLNAEDREYLDAPDPRGVPRESLTAVGGPAVMIDLDEDVVTALPPGCRVRRLVMSARGPLGPDWTVYWVESEWGDSRPILDLVESQKLHPPVVFVSDQEPSDLADLVHPYLPDAFEIPTNPLTAHSHNPGVVPRFPEHPDAGLS